MIIKKTKKLLFTGVISLIILGCGSSPEYTSAKLYIKNTTVQSMYVTTNASLPDRVENFAKTIICLLYTSPSPRDRG